ncbi:hypothetical protein GGR56DRAFT_36353 [Xylariaceae sp. FL0804]|nr:hypothetical protein GGR56DRAFT_36353 [Xylariaceae sp. FL0804]
MEPKDMEPKNKPLVDVDPAPPAAALGSLDPQPRRSTTAFQPSSPSSRRRSQSSLESEPQEHPFASASCVSREAMSEQDCARYRFIVWAAVERNRSVRMAAADRLKCPLLLCGKSFEDHETMLRHLSGCDHLSTGEYLCWECMKVERFNDRSCRCRRRLDHPPKRRRILDKARSLFSTIGSKTRRDESRVIRRSDCLVPPPSYESLVVDTCRQYEQRERQQHQQDQRRGEGEGLEQEPQPPLLELNGTELPMELDSELLSPTSQLDAVNYAFESLDSPSPEATPSEPGHETGPTHGQSSKAWLTPNRSTPLHPPKPLPSSSESRRPSLTLDTHLDRYRNVPQTTQPSVHSLRSCNTLSPATPWCASSTSSGAWTMTSSIDTTMTSPITPFSANGPPAVSQMNRVIDKDEDATACSEDLCEYSFGNVFELAGDDHLSLAVPRGLSDPSLFSIGSKDNYSWISSVDTEISLGTSVNMMFTDPNSKPTDLQAQFDKSPVSTSETVQSTWDVLQEHVASSMEKLPRNQGNHLANQLLSKSTREVASVGLAHLRKLLNGIDSTDPLDYLCFVHVMFAFSLVLEGDHVLSRSKELYDQALAYQGRINPSYVPLYCQVVNTIWKPILGRQGQYNADAAPSRSRSKGKEPEHGSNSDPLLVMGQNYLDDLESSVFYGDAQQGPEVIASELSFTHSTDYHPSSSQIGLAATSMYIVQVLSQRFQDFSNLLPRLKAIGQSAQAGYIPTIRRLELQLFDAGKRSLPAVDRYTNFFPEVRKLCDQIYAQQDSSRVRFQQLGVSLVETLLQSITQEAPNPQQDPRSYPQALENPMTEFLDDPFLRDLHNTFPDPMYLGFPPVPTGPSTKLPVPTTTHSATPNETFAVSPRDSPDLAGAATRPRSASARIEGGGGGERGAAPPAAATPSSSSGQQQPKTEADECCEICGYRPKGDPQWFRGSMAKHKKMQHSNGPPRIYKCPYPGCNSQYKNRQDNLRQHQIEKNHFVGDEASRRPPKRKRISPQQ